MEIMPGTTLHDLDLTDSDTLLDYFFWFVKKQEKKPKSEEKTGEIVYRNGKPYKKVSASNAEWTKSMF